mmetsp:Transcript_52605/g.118901  ORF Transcript_52605/g.118901 Transcript_52605/m.118901 type:complete len:278 (-) Transcript_52605:34-867(-)
MSSRLVVLGILLRVVAGAALEGNVSFFKVDYPEAGDCGQLSCPGADVVHAPHLFQGFEEGTCAQAGYAAAKGQPAKPLLLWGRPITVSLFVRGRPLKAETAAALENVSVYKADYPRLGECGQATCPAWAATFPQRFAGFKEGTCADGGYILPQGTKNVRILGPFLKAVLGPAEGRRFWWEAVPFQFFGKDKVAVKVISNVTIFQVGFPEEGRCGEAVAPPASADSSGLFEGRFRGFQEGTCASVGYSVHDGSQDLQDALLGKSITVHLFRKGGEFFA